MPEFILPPPHPSVKESYPRGDDSYDQIQRLQYVRNTYCMHPASLAAWCLLLSILSSQAAAAGLLSARVARLGVLPRVCGGGYLTFLDPNFPQGSVRFRGSVAAAGGCRPVPHGLHPRGHGARMGRLGLLFVARTSW